MKIRAYAKINLALDVVRRREDGYHDLEMVMAPIELHDLIYINKIDSGIQITSNSYKMPTDERNIMYKVAKIMIDRYNLDSGVKIHIYKHIPTQAGLAGGSADGAAVLKAMNKLFNLKLSYETLAEIGKEVGADIPFCIYEKMAVVKGIGEQLDFIDNDFECYVMLVKPKKGVSTANAFQSLDIEHATHPHIEDMRKGIINNDLSVVVKSLGNTLEAPSIKMVNEIDTIKMDLLKCGFDGVLMSGSGSCVFGLTKNKEIMDQSYNYLKNNYYFVRKSKILKKG
jgi:4-diphosphocytidyl-2-C-methyl-D-erythritol kinase